MHNFLEEPIGKRIKQIKIQDILICLIVLIAIISRISGLGDRVMSHDEVNHVVPSFDFFSGRGYRHDPVTHGPFQFHLMALSYFLFGDNDFTSRLPHALFSIAAVIFVSTFYRRYLGKFGAIAAGILFTISPFLLFYGRYARNDTICVFLGVTTIYSILRYFESNHNKYLYYFTVLIGLNFITKETAYIFSAQLLVFFLILFIRDLVLIKWKDVRKRTYFLFINIVGILVIIASVILSVYLFRSAYINAQNITQPSINSDLSPIKFEEIIEFVRYLLKYAVPGLIPLVIGILFFIFMRKYLRWDVLAESRSFSLLILLGTLVLPLLAPFLVRFAGMDPSVYSDPLVLITNYLYIGYFFILSYIWGSLWNREIWLQLAGIFFGIYIIFYSTFFTNNIGLLTGMVGSLGHWLNQQSVQRGGQPYYYYAFFLIPIYEFLAAFGTLLAFVIGIKQKSFWTKYSELSYPEKETDPKNLSTFKGGKNVINWIVSFPEQNHIPNPAIYIFLVITGLIAYTIAGEKMPWLTLHIIFPMLLASGWAIDWICSRFLSSYLSEDKIFNISVFALLINSLIIFLQLLGNQVPFQGKTQQALQNTYQFIFLIFLESGILYFLINSKTKDKKRKTTLTIIFGLFLLLSLITIRTAYRASFINYDFPKEYLVYAHAADGPKHVLNQIEEISRRTTTGLDIKVAYDNHGLYPYWWYLRHYPNKIVYMEDPTRSLEDVPLIIAGQDKYAKLDPIIRDNYHIQEYMRLWWPMQDYWHLNWERISSAVTDMNMRQALINIWFNRDYSLYAEVNNNQHLTLETWLPSDKMRFYIRKDIAAQMWQYTTEASLEQSIETDPYTGGMVSHAPDGFISMSGSEPGNLNAPRGLDIASDGSIYVADSLNHRIQQFSPEGLLLDVWGSYANVLEEDAPGGTFNEPWDVAIAPDGSIFVADSFNHRIQKFDATGKFVKMWGIFAQGDRPDSFWGPRGITVDENGNVFITDTGNKRVVVFDKDLNFLSQIGGGGFEPGKFDEPVGIAVNSSGQIIVADTWNRRVQILSTDESGIILSPVKSFDISGWYGQGIDNKPYISTGLIDEIYLTDPEIGRILQFNSNGEFIQGYQDMNISEDMLTQPFGLNIDAQGRLWFCDAASNVISFIDID